MKLLSAVSESKELVKTHIELLHAKEELQEREKTVDLLTAKYNRLAASLTNCTGPNIPRKVVVIGTKVVLIEQDKVTLLDAEEHEG